MMHRKVADNGGMGTDSDTRESESDDRKRAWPKCVSGTESVDIRSTDSRVAALADVRP